MTAGPGTRIVACCGGMVTFGGAERMTLAALRALVDAGASVHCILNGWEFQAIAREVERTGASWSTSAYRVRLDIRTRSLVSIGRQVADVLRTSWDLGRFILSLRATHIVVPAHDVAIRNWPSLLLARAARRRVVLMLHNAPEATRFYRRLWRWVINPVVDQFVCNSDYTRSELLACGIPPGKVERVYYMVPERRGGEQVHQPVDGRLIFVGQVIPEKGLHVLLEAVALLAGRGLDVTLDVVGDVDGWISPTYGDYRQVLKARAARPDLAGRIRFLGFREDVPALLGRAALHCCPSMPEQREAFGLVVIEAKAAGVPSVVFPTGALPEIVMHQVDGWVCDAATAESLADGCEALLRAPDDRRRLGANAREAAAAYSRGAFAEAWRGVFGLTGGPSTVIETIGAAGKAGLRRT